MKRRFFALVLVLLFACSALAMTAGATEFDKDKGLSVTEMASGSYSGDPIFLVALADPNGDDMYVFNVFLYRDPNSNATYLIGDTGGNAVYDDGFTDITIYGDNGWSETAEMLGSSEDFTYYYAPGLSSVFPYVPNDTIPGPVVMYLRDLEEGNVTDVMYDEFDMGDFTDRGEAIWVNEGSSISDTIILGAPICDPDDDKVVGMVTMVENRTMAMVDLIHMTLPFEGSLDYIEDDALPAETDVDDDGSQGGTGETNPGSGDDTNDNNSDDNGDEPEIDEEKEWEKYLPIIVCVVLGAAAAFFFLRKKPGQKPVQPVPPTPPMPPVPPTPPVPPVNNGNGMMEMDLPLGDLNLGGTIGGTIGGGTINVQASQRQWQLRALNGVHYGKTFPISGTVLMGRVAGSGISFPEGTPGISGRHCQLVADGAGVMLTDLGSSYGTFYNGQRLKENIPCPLQSGDTFTLAPNGQSFRVEAAGATVGSSFFKPVVRSGDGKEYRADQSGKLTFGRNPDNQVTIQEKSVSGRHCTLYRENGRLFLRDEGSTNGTFLNGQRLQSGVPVPVGRGSSFYLYSPQYSFTITEE